MNTSADGLDRACAERKSFPKVVLVVSHLYPTLGMERAAIELGRLLSPHVNASFACMGDDVDVLPKDLDVITLGCKRTGWKRLLLMGRLRSYGASADPNIVFIVVGAWAAIPWLLAARRESGRTIVWEHSLNADRGRSSRSLRLLQRAAKVIYGCAAAVVCVSPALAADIGRLNPKICTVHISNAYCTPDERTLLRRLEQRRSSGTNVLTVGSLSITKNQQLAIRAMAKLSADYTLEIAGHGPQRGALEELVQRLGLSGRVRFLGHLDERGMAAAYERADVVVHPSRGETFGYAYVEAADHAIPVVSLEHASSVDLVPTAVPGQIVAASADAIATAVLDACKKRPTVAEVLAARTVRADRWNSPTVRDQWMRLISRVAKDGFPNVRQVSKL